MDLDGLNLTDAQWQELFHIDPASQLAEAADAAAYFDRFDGRVPAELRAQLGALTNSLERLATEEPAAAVHPL